MGAISGYNSAFITSPFSIVIVTTGFCAMLVPPFYFHSLSIVAEINADVKKNPRNNKVMRDKLWYTGNKGTGTDAGALIKSKTDKKMDKIIDKIWFDFSDTVEEREINQWIINLRG
jgi:hypothetical protein